LSEFYRAAEELMLLLMLVQGVAVDHFERQLVANVFDGWRQQALVSQQQ